MFKTNKYYTCERCQGLQSGFVTRFGHSEILGQILDTVCPDCTLNILFEYKRQADQIKGVRKEIQELKEAIFSLTRKAQND